MSYSDTKQKVPVLQQPLHNFLCISQYSFLQGRFTFQSRVKSPKVRAVLLCLFARKGKTQSSGTRSQC